MDTHFPWEMAADITLRGVTDAGMKLAVRIPDYAKHFTVKALQPDGTGQKLSFVCEKGYAVI